MAKINPETGLGVNNKNGYRHGTKEWFRDRELRAKYKITLAKWLSMLIQQNNCCKICGTTEPRGKNWHTDHNHVTGKVRGILCGWCNTALGKFQENPLILKEAIKYLETEGSKLDQPK